jgi:hemerythrin superfamily protein
MNATKFLINDHNEVRGMFSKMDSSKDPAKRHEIFNELHHALDAHARIEEELFYPMVEKLSDMRPLVVEARKEHDLFKSVLRDVAGMKAGDRDFAPKLKVLRETVEHHIDEEEKSMFPKVEKLCDKNTLDDLGNRLKTRRDEIMKKFGVHA